MEPPLPEENPTGAGGLSQSGFRPPPPVSPLPSPTSLSTSNLFTSLGAGVLNLTNFPGGVGSSIPAALLSASGGNSQSLATLLESYAQGGSHEFPTATGSSGFWEALGNMSPNLATLGGLPSPTSLPQANAGLSLDQLSQLSKQPLSAILPHAFVPPAPTAKRKKSEWELDVPERIPEKRATLGSSDPKGSLGNSDEVNSWLAGVPSRERGDDVKKEAARLDNSDSQKAAIEALSKHIQVRIEQQPAPKSLFINRRVTPSFRVKVMWTPEISIKQLGPVKAVLTPDSAENAEMLNAEETLDAKDHSATFTNLKFSVGTHQRITNIYFVLHVTTAKGETFQIESPPSEPFIVCTNIKQWIKSEGAILRRVIFGEAAYATWAAVAATIQKHFLLTVGAQRALSADDLQAMHIRLGGQEGVNKSAFNDFWTTWYGPVLKLAYQKPGRVLWEKGIIYGVITAAAAEGLIKAMCPSGLIPGVFLVRFFDGVDPSASGRPVITYVTAEGTVVHYKLSDKEKKTPFHEFLAVKKMLSALIQPPQGSTPKRLVVKDALLRELRPSRAKKAGGEGDESDGPDD